MDLKTREDYELDVSRGDEGSHTSEKLVKFVAAGAVLGFLFHLFRKLWMPLGIAPPIIIKSYDDEPIEIGSERPLEETNALAATGSSLLVRKHYELPGFNYVVEVDVRRRSAATGEWVERTYSNPAGFRVQMWLQYLDGS